MGSRRFEEGGWRKKHLESKIEDGGLWIGDRPSNIEDFIMSHLIYFGSSIVTNHAVLRTL